MFIGRLLDRLDKSFEVNELQDEEISGKQDENQKKMPEFEFKVERVDESLTPPEDTEVSLNTTHSKQQAPTQIEGGSTDSQVSSSSMPKPSEFLEDSPSSVGQSNTNHKQKPPAGKTSQQRWTILKSRKPNQKQEPSSRTSLPWSGSKTGIPSTSPDSGRSSNDDPPKPQPSPSATQSKQGQHPNPSQNSWNQTGSKFAPKHLINSPQDAEKQPPSVPNNAMYQTALPVAGSKIGPPQPKHLMPPSKDAKTQPLCLPHSATHRTALPVAGSKIGPPQPKHLMNSSQDVKGEPPSLPHNATHQTASPIASSKRGLPQLNHLMNPSQDPKDKPPNPPESSALQIALPEGGSKIQPPQPKHLMDPSHDAKKIQAAKQHAIRQEEASLQQQKLEETRRKRKEEQEEATKKQEQEEEEERQASLKLQAAKERAMLQEALKQKQLEETRRREAKKKQEQEDEEERRASMEIKRQAEKKEAAELKEKKEAEEVQAAKQQAILQEEASLQQKLEEARRKEEQEEARKKQAQEEMEKRQASLEVQAAKQQAILQEEASLQKKLEEARRQEEQEEARKKQEKEEEEERQASLELQAAKQRAIIQEALIQKQPEETRRKEAKKKQEQEDEEERRASMEMKRPETEKNEAARLKAKKETEICQLLVDGPSSGGTSKVGIPFPDDWDSFAFSVGNDDQGKAIRNEGRTEIAMDDSTLVNRGLPGDSLDVCAAQELPSSFGKSTTSSHIQESDGLGKEGISHLFVREKVRFGWDCLACGGLWDDGGSAISPFYRCSECGMVVHAACRKFTQASLACTHPMARALGFSKPTTVNCPGVLHVKVDQVFDLKNVSGMSVHCVLQLWPWRTKVKTKAGEWGPIGEVVWGRSLVGKHALSHLYNDESTPLPTLRVEVKSTTLGVIEDTVGYAEIPVLPLMCNPKMPVSRWFILSSPKEGANEADKIAFENQSGGGQSQMRGCGRIFLTMEFVNHKQLLSSPRKPISKPQKSRTASNSSSGSFYRPSNSSFDQEHSVSPEKDHLDESQTTSDGVNTKVHHFRLRTYFGLTWCAVCQSALLGLRQQGYECETCGLNVHAHCQMSANIEHRCEEMLHRPSETENSQSNEILNEEPLKETKEGVGTLLVSVSNAHACSPDCPKAGHESSSTRLEGDHYLRLQLGDENVRTRTVYQSSDPHYGEQWVFIAKTFRDDLKIELTEATKDKVIGSIVSTPLSLIQKDIDAKIRGHQIPSKVFHYEEFRDAGGKVVGRCYLKIQFKQHSDLYPLWGPEQPRPLPPHPPDAFSVDQLRRHIERVQAVVGWFQDAGGKYQRVMSWESPALTSMCMAMFLYCCLFVDAEYASSIPPFLLLVYMSVKLLKRKNNSYVLWWVEKGGGFGSKESEEKQMLTNYRPVSRLKTTVVSGKGFDVYEGSLVVKISYSTTGEPKPEGPELMVGHCQALNNNQAEVQFQAQPTESSNSSEYSRLLGLARHSANPLLQSLELWPRRNPSQGEREDIALVYPLLPLLPSPLTNQRTASALRVWSPSTAALRFTVIEYGRLTEYYIGQVVLPIALLISEESSSREQGEVEGWYPMINEVGQPLESELYIRAQMILHNPNEPLSKNVLSHSKVIQDLQKTEITQQKLSVKRAATNSLATVWNIKSTFAFIQNLLGSVLDKVETMKNILNWTHPKKSAIIYIFFILVYLLLVFIPIRLIILFVGLQQFLSKFIFKKAQAQVEVQVGPSAGAARIANFLGSIPTDADLRLIYKWEHQDYIGKKKAVEDAVEERTRLKTLLQYQWEGYVRLLCTSTKAFLPTFAVLQGHRLMIWTKHEDFHKGKQATQQLLMQGHAGITQPSPLETRLLEDPLLLISVFGRNLQGKPEKISLLFSTASEKDGFELNVCKLLQLKTD